MPTDLKHAATLGLSMMTAFTEVAARYGVRLEGIEHDANEHSDFFQQVARQLLANEGSPKKGDDNGK